MLKQSVNASYLLTYLLLIITDWLLIINWSYNFGLGLNILFLVLFPSLPDIVRIHNSTARNGAEPGPIIWH